METNAWIELNGTVRSRTDCSLADVSSNTKHGVVWQFILAYLRNGLWVPKAGIAARSSGIMAIFTTTAQTGIDIFIKLHRFMTYVPHSTWTTGRKSLSIKTRAFFCGLRNKVFHIPGFVWWLSTTTIRKDHHGLSGAVFVLEIQIHSLPVFGLMRGTTSDHWYMKVTRVVKSESIEADSMYAMLLDPTSQPSFSRIPEEP
jgi:hypothetical protein